ncbi:hypothetical protein [Spirosoma areae]
MTMNTVIERTEQYHNLFQQAHTDAERQQLVASYKAYYTQLTETDKVAADKLNGQYFAETERRIDDMEPALQRAKDKLNRYQQTA